MLHANRLAMLESIPNATLMSLMVSFKETAWIIMLLNMLVTEPACLEVAGLSMYCLLVIFPIFT